MHYRIRITTDEVKNKNKNIFKDDQTGDISFRDSGLDSADFEASSLSPIPASTAATVTEIQKVLSQAKSEIRRSRTKERRSYEHEMRKRIRKREKEEKEKEKKMVLEGKAEVKKKHLDDPVKIATNLLKHEVLCNFMLSFTFKFTNIRDGFLKYKSWLVG